MRGVAVPMERPPLPIHPTEITGEHTMTKILFICHGNICRSPMAEFVMKDLVERAGAAERFEIDKQKSSECKIP